MSMIPTPPAILDNAVATRMMATGQPLDRSQIALAPLFRMPTDAVGVWTTAGATVSADIVNYMSCEASTRANLKLTGNGVAVTIQSDNDLAGGDTNLTSALYRIRFKINDATNMTHAEGIRMYLGSDGNFSDNYQWQQLWLPTGANLPGPDGWFEVWGSINDTTWNETGTLDPAAVDIIRLRIRLSAASAAPNVTFDGPHFFTIPTRTPKMAITFDDGLVTQYAAATYMYAKGLVGTFYVVTDNIDSGANYLTTEQLLRMQSMGHMIANHTSDHGFWVTDSYTQEQKIAGVSDGAKWLSDNGLGRGAMHLAVPGGTANIVQSDVETIAGKLCSTFRATANTDPMPRSVLPPGGNILTTQGVADDPDGADGAGAVLTNIKTIKMNAAVLFHHGDEANVTGIETFFDNCATDQDAGDVEIVTVDKI